MEQNSEIENNVLNLILNEHAAHEDVGERIIYEYESAKDIGAKILEDFLKFYDKRAKGFPLDEKNNKQKFGSITDIMALSTFLELKSLDVDMSACEAIYYGLIEKVFADIYRGDQIIFDAKPYWESEGYAITTYVETASKLISTLVDLRGELIERLYKKKNKLPMAVVIRGKEIADSVSLLDYTERLIVDAAEMLNGAALPVADPFEYLIDGKKTSRTGVDPTVVCRGWAFQRPAPGTESEYETSLYYTYYGTNAFISIYNSMEDYYDYLDGGAELFANLDKNSLNVEEKQRYFKYLKDAEFYRNYQAALDRMRNLTASSGRYIETRLQRNGINIAFDYIDKELKAVSLDTIGRGKNNHVMNSLFAFATLINAGVDDDYASVGKTSIFQTIQFALTNIKKIYLTFKDDRREDLIDSFSLGEDRCPGDVSMIMQSWRKSGTISTYDLVPLYCNTYNLISNYVIKYPQKEMRENLVWLLENKSPKGWYWTQEGFSINSNLYYIYALDSFYGYYRRYEADFLNADGLRNDLAKKEREIVRVKENAEKAIQKNKEAYELSLQEISRRRSPLDTEVENIVTGVLDSVFSQYFEKTFENYVNEGIEFVLRAINSGAEARDDIVQEFYGNKKLQLIFTASSLELSGSSAREKNISDIETDKQKDRLYRALFEKILNKLYN